MSTREKRTDTPGAEPGDESLGGRREQRTIHDVARRAKVSVGTVSKALNDKGRLRQETRERVIAAANDLDFRPNSLAQSLHSARSMTVGILSTDSFGRFTFPILEALERRLFDHGIAVFMCNATDDPVRERRHIDQLIGKRVDGLVVTARRSDRRDPISPAARGLPVVYALSQVENPEALCLLPDDEGGAKLAVSHLAALGRRRIAHITGPERFEAVRLREMGWSKALAEAGLKAAAGDYRPGRWSEIWGREAAQNSSRIAATRPTRSSAATTRSRAESSMRCATWGWPSRRTSRSSVSTTGRSWRRPRVRRSPAST